MNASASSSSAWPTATAGAARKGADHVRRDTGNPNSDLPTAVSLWPTPATRDHKGANSPDHLENGTGKKHLDQLPNFVEHLWYTPNVPNGGRTLSAEATTTGMTPEERKQQVGLENQARFWSTPRASDAEKGGPNQAFGLGGGAPLPAQTANWATPTSLSYGDSHQPGNSRNQNINLDLAETLHILLTGPALDLKAYTSANIWPTPTAMNRPRSDETLEKCRASRKAKAGQNTVPLYLEDVASRLSLPAPATSRDGEPSSKERRSLNPLFVEWLMGWPPGWTLLAWTDFACSGTELSRYRQHMRSAFLRLALPPEAPPAQLALFG